MTRIIIIRHGKTEWNIKGIYQGETDIPLSAEGKQKAEALAKVMPRLYNIAAIYSSDLQRAAQTAEPIAKAYGLPLNKSADYREMGFGDWEGLTYEEIFAKWPQEIEEFFIHPAKVIIPHGGSLQEVRDRALQQIDKLCLRHPEQTIALVTHGAFIKTLLAGLLDMPLDNIWRLLVDNTSLNIIQGNGTYRCLEMLNYNLAAAK